VAAYIRSHWCLYVVLFGSRMSTAEHCLYVVLFGSRLSTAEQYNIETLFGCSLLPNSTT